MRRTFALLGAGVALAACLFTAGGCPRRPSLDVLLVTVDTLRADRLGCYGYAKARTPAFDRLASEGVLFEHALTAVPGTLASHATMFTGKYPPSHGIRHNGLYVLREGQRTLAEMFRDAGYETAAFVAAAPLARVHGLDRGFALYDDAFLDKPDTRRIEETLYPNQRRAEDVFASARKWLENRDGRKPFFVWIHLFDPHTPHMPPPSYREAWSRLVDEEAGYTLDRALYDAEVAYTDSELDSFAAWLDARMKGRPWLLALTADHGEGLGDHGEPTHGFFLYETTMHVPLVFRGGPIGADAAGRRVAGNVSLVDIAPTFAALAGVDETIPSWEGFSLAPLIRGEAREVPARTLYGETLAAFYEQNWAPAFGVWKDSLKFIRLPIPEIYDWSRDPAEEHNLWDEEPSLRPGLEKALEDMERGFPAVDSSPRMPDAETRARLESLGYLGHSMPDPSEAARRKWKGLPDPKERTAMFAPAQEAMFWKLKGRPDKALPLWKKVMEIAPENQGLRVEKALAHLELGQPREASAEADVLELRFGSSATLLRLRGMIAEAGGDAALAEDFFKRAIAMDGEYMDARVSLAELYESGKNFLAAQKTLEEALLKRPRGADILSRLGFLLLQQDDDVGAGKYFRRSLEIGPTGQALFGSARLDMRAGRYAQAFESLRAALEMEPANADFHYAMAELQALSGNPVEEKKALENFLNLAERDDPRLAIVRHRLGKTR